MRLPVSLVVASSAAAAALFATASVAQAPAMPQRKDGLWEMTMKMSSPMPVNVTSKQCTDASTEKGGEMFRGGQGGMQGAGGVSCKAGPVLPVLGGGYSYSSVCTMKGMTMSTRGTAKGDFRSGYHMESTTKMDPAPMPQMAESHMSIDAKWVGPCPADMKPGDTIVNGRKFSRPKT